MTSEKNDYRDVRREYAATPLHRKDLSAHPVEQFTTWLHQAQDAAEVDVTAMSLATVNPEGQPSARIVLLKHFNHDGFAWYTDYRSRKGQDLAQNPQAALLFYWPTLHRQVRIEGLVTRLDAGLNDRYFSNRPKDSQISAAISEQSAVVGRQEVLAQKVSAYLQEYAEKPVSRPKDWGGYCLQPVAFEFWQGRENRLHDRFQYQRIEGVWHIARLQP